MATPPPITVSSRDLDRLERLLESPAVAALPAAAALGSELERANVVAPADIEGTARALEQALKMSADERAWRARKMTDQIEQHDIGMARPDQTDRFA